MNHAHSHLHLRPNGVIYTPEGHNLYATEELLSAPKVREDVRHTHEVMQAVIEQREYSQA